MNDPQQSPRRPPQVYETTEIQEAAYLKALGYRQIGVRPQKGSRDYMTFVFDIPRERAQELWQEFQNLESNAKVHPRRLMIEYEGLRTQRIRS
jgi:hypothetical protein